MGKFVYGTGWSVPNLMFNKIITGSYRESVIELLHVFKKNGLFGLIWHRIYNSLDVKNKAPIMGLILKTPSRPIIYCSCKKE